MTLPTLIYRPPPTLADFMTSPARNRVAMGPVGSGKTTCCMLELLRRAKEQRPGPDGKRRSRFAVIRGSYRQLKDTSRRTFEQWIGRPEFGEWREVDFAFHYRSGDVESEFQFRSLDQPDDIPKLLSLELTGAMVNEFREMSKSVFDALSARVGRYPARLYGGPTWAGIIGDSNPWHARHWAGKLFKSGPDFALFRQPSGLSAEAENVENLEPGYYSRLCAGKDQDWISVYVDGKDPIGAEGTVYGRQIDELETRGGLQEFKHEYDRVFCAFDLGQSDATSIFWFRFGPEREFQIVDWFEASGRSLSFYFDVIESKPYEIDSLWLPHDAKARLLAAQTSIQSQFMERFGASRVEIVPMMSVEDGIAAGRWLLERPNLQIHPRCNGGIELLRDYHYAWDDESRVYGRRPIHDGSSHTADAWRYLSIVVRHLESVTRPVEKGPEIDASKMKGFITLGEDGVYRSNWTFDDVAKPTIDRAKRRERRRHI